MKILLDMNLSPRWTSYLESYEVNAVNWAELGAGNAPDSSMMQYARVHGFCVLTQDLDFGMILAATRGESPSVIQIRADDLAPDTIGPQVVLAIERFAEELIQGALLTVDPTRTRVSVLPLRYG